MKPQPSIPEAATAVPPTAAGDTTCYFRHYKGNYYRMLGVARHSETLEELVVYQALYGDRGMWVRPRAMFFEDVVVGGRPEPRFRRVDRSEVPAECLLPPTD